MVFGVRVPSPAQPSQPRPAQTTPDHPSQPSPAQLSPHTHSHPLRPASEGRGRVVSIRPKGRKQRSPVSIQRRLKPRVTKFGDGYACGSGCQKQGWPEESARHVPGGQNWRRLRVWERVSEKKGVLGFCTPCVPAGQLRIWEPVSDKTWPLHARCPWRPNLRHTTS